MADHNRDSDEESWSGEDFQCKCLFTDEILESAQAVFEEAKNHGFDFQMITSQLQLDFYGKIKILNFIRTQVVEGQTAEEIIEQILNSNVWQDDKFMAPALDNDSILFQLDEDPDEPRNLEQENAELRRIISSLQENQKEMSHSYQRLLEKLDKSDPDPVVQTAQEAGNTGAEVQNTQAGGDIRTAETYFEQVDRIEKALMENLDQFLVIQEEDGVPLKTDAEMLLDQCEGAPENLVGKLFLQMMEENYDDDSVQGFARAFSDFIGSAGIPS